MSDKVKLRVDLRSKEDKSNKVTSLSENSTNTQYPSAKTVYDELMTVRTITPKIIDGSSFTLNNVTKDWHETSHIIRPDFEHFEKIVYNITFEDNDFQMFFQQPSNSSGIYIIYFDGNDCYWGEADDNTGDLTQGSLICEGNTIQATVNKDNTITVGDTITNWDISSRIAMFGDVDFTYTVYSHKYLDTDFPYNFGYANSSMGPIDNLTVNSVTKEYGELYLSEDWENTVERIYTITFNDDDFSYLYINYKEIIYFDGTDCYWGEWDENDNSVLNKGTLICEGNVVQAIYNDYNDDWIYFPDGTSISNMNHLSYFGDVNIKVRNKALALEYVSNKTHYLTDSFNDSICYPSIATLKDYAEDKSNKTSSWNSTTDNTRYPTEKLVKDSLDLKSDNTHIHTIDLNSFNFYNADNWRTIDGNTPTTTSDSVQANAVSHHILNKEFLKSKHYTLTFEFNIGSNRGGFYLFGDKDCNMLFEITTDIGNTVTLQHDSNGNTTELYTGTKNHFTSGWHNIRVIRKGDIAIVYIDDELYYTFNNIGNATNIFGLLKWSSGSATIKNIDVSLDITELPIEDYIEKDNLKTIEGVNLVGNEDIAIDVSCGSTVIFEDGGVTGDKNSNWVTENTVSINTTSNGTKITSSNSSDNHNYYIADVLLQGDFEVEFTLVDGHWWDYLACFLDTNYDIFTALAFASFSNGGAYVGSSMSSLTKTITTTHSYPVSVKITRVGSTFTLYENDTELGTYTSNSNPCYFAFAINSDASRYSTYKDLTITTIGSGGSTVLYQPTLDGTENFYKINSSYTPTYSSVGGVNQVCDACGYLSDGWDNTINWKLTFEYYYNYHRWGDSGALVTFNNVTARDRNSLQFWSESLFSHQGTGSATVVNSQSVLVSEQWNKVEITKNGSDLTIVINDTNTYTVTNTDFNDPTRTRAVIGLDNTGSNNHSCIRNIKVESLGGGSENTIYLGDDIMTMIDTALGHMITNWEDYE